jgi:hypothetical protein
MLANVFRFFVLKIKGRSMVRALCISLALLIGCHGEGQSLQINIKANDEEKLIYLHMWGPIVPGDDEMFKSTILPYLRNGYLLFQVMTFTSGGDVRAAMRIGDQIRTLQARTVAPTQFVNEPGYAQCWFVASAANGGVGYSPSTNYKRQLATGTGASWCNCASACFLIWASGATREGNYVGIHRFKFDELFYGGLAAGQARELYTKAENDYRSYLTRLNISEAILDRLFATDSRSMYYLTHNELQMIQSTPYLEELTQAKCPP